jgi:hypothetical protein
LGLGEGGTTRKGVPAPDQAGLVVGNGVIGVDREAELLGSVHGFSPGLMACGIGV